MFKDTVTLGDELLTGTWAGRTFRIEKSRRFCWPFLSALYMRHCCYDHRTIAAMWHMHLDNLTCRTCAAQLSQRLVQTTSVKSALRALTYSCDSRHALACNEMKADLIKQLLTGMLCKNTHSCRDFYFAPKLT